MAKGSDNPFPSVLAVEGTVPTSPASGNQRLYLDSADHKLKRVNSSGLITTAESGPFAVTAYGPDTEFLSAGAATSVTAISTSNLRLAIPSTFAGGSVIVRLSCLGQMNAAGNGYWGLLESAAVVALAWTLNNASNIQRYEATFRLTGLTSGAHNYDWAYKVSAGSMNLWASPVAGGTNGWGLALMEAWTSV